MWLVGVLAAISWWRLPSAGFVVASLLAVLPVVAIAARARYRKNCEDSGLAARLTPKQRSYLLQHAQFFAAPAATRAIGQVALFLSPVCIILLLPFASQGRWVSFLAALGLAGAYGYVALAWRRPVVAAHVASFRNPAGDESFLLRAVADTVNELPPNFIKTFHKLPDPIKLEQAIRWSMVHVRRFWSVSLRIDDDKQLLHAYPVCCALAGLYSQSVADTSIDELLLAAAKPISDDPVGLVRLFSRGAESRAACEAIVDETREQFKSKDPMVVATKLSFYLLAPAGGAELCTEQQVRDAFTCIAGIARDAEAHCSRRFIA